MSEFLQVAFFRERVDREESEIDAIIAYWTQVIIMHIG